MITNRVIDMIDIDDVCFVFNTNVLKKGDILLINTYNERLHERMNTSYDHVALYAGDAFIVESDGGGVALNHVFSYGFKSINDAIVLRLKNNSEELGDKAVFYARSTMGMEFGSLEANRVPDYSSTDNKALSNRMFCSRLVAQSYSKIGIQLVQNPDYCTTDSFLSSDFLFAVENALIEADNDTKKVVEKHSKARERAENVEMLLELYQKMSAVFNSDVQTFDQLVKASLSHPEKEDRAIEEILTTNYYKKRLSDRDFYCLNDKETFHSRYCSYERRVWFLLNQKSHLEKTYIPSISANVLSFVGLSKCYPNSKVIKFFMDFFKEQENELRLCSNWINSLLNETIDENPDKFISLIHPM